MPEVPGLASRNLPGMMHALRDTGKRTAGWLVSRAVPQYRFENGIFILAHMRCGSTALSNILCSRPDISGYGEAHVRYEGRADLGQLALNQMRRGGWELQASHLFDKILHSRYDSAVPPEFFTARAIFLVRRPGDAILSIVRLFCRLGKDEYRTQDEAADYYIERLTALEALWHRFPAERRIGLTHEALVRDPERALAAISAGLELQPPLVNRYASLAASRRGGGGDPLKSGQFTRIERLRHELPADALLDLAGSRAEECEELYLRLYRLFTGRESTALRKVHP